MTKTAVQIDLVCVEDPSATMRIHAILGDGKLHSEEMYCHLNEDCDGSKQIIPGILTLEQEDVRLYVGEWYRDTRRATFEFGDQPLVVDQLVHRWDGSGVEAEPSSYRIAAITDLLA